MAAIPPPVHSPLGFGDTVKVAARESYLFGLSFLLRQRIVNPLPQFSPNFDNHQLPVAFLVPGYLEKPGCFSTLYQELIWSGVRVALYEPRYALAGVEEMANDFACFMNLTLSREACENSPVYLIGHSMGGLIVRQAMLNRWSKPHQVEHLFTLASPNNGTRMAHFGVGDCVVDMLPGSGFLQRLNKHDQKWRHKMTSIIATPDALILHARYAKLEGAHNQIFHRCGHMALLDDQRLFRLLKQKCQPDNPHQLLGV